MFQQGIRTRETIITNLGYDPVSENLRVLQERAPPPCGALPLQPIDNRIHAQHHARILTVTLVAPSPPRIPAHRQTRRKRVRDPRRPHLQRSRAANPPHQRRVPSAPQANVVREDRSPIHIVVTMHGVDAVEEGNAQPRPESAPLEAVRHGDPLGRGRAEGRFASAAAEHAADAVPLEHGGVRNRALDLGHLAYLLLKCHAGEEVRDAAFHGLAPVLVNLAIRELSGAER